MKKSQRKPLKSSKSASNKSVPAVPKGFSTVTPFLVADNADNIIEFMKKAFRGKETFMSRDDKDRVIHAIVQIGNSNVMLSDAMENYPAQTCMLYLYLDNVDKVYQTALDAGATSIREPLTEFYGDRSASVKDEGGNIWWIATHVEDVEGKELKKRTEKFLKEQSRETVESH